VWVHSLTLPYTPKSMKCDSRASLLAHTFASPCFGHEPEVRVATFKVFFGDFIYFSNKTWDYAIIWIDVFNNIEKHKLLQ
jgi:hypothetical protein